MKKIFTLFLSLFSFFPLMLIAEEEADIFPKIDSAISAEKWNDTEQLFQKALEYNVPKAESYFWAKLPTVKSEASVIMAWKLGFHYKDNRSYDKAQLFFAELFRMRPQDIDVICINAEIAVLRGNTKEGLKLYEEALAMDPHNLSANIFIGNYYYMQAEKEKKKIEKNYKQLSSPTRMQYADYRNSLQALLITDYAKAREHLKRVINQFSSTEAKKLLNQIELVEKDCRK